MIFCNDKIGIAKGFATQMESGNDDLANEHYLGVEGVLKIIAMDKCRLSRNGPIFTGLLAGIVALSIGHCK